MRTKPLYIRIKEYLIDIIHRNADVPNFKLPSETQLVVKFNASRVSVRNAFNELQKLGYIERIQGKGTFIRSNCAINSDEKNSPNENICLITPRTDTKYTLKIIDGLNTFCDDNHYNLVIMVSNNKIEKEKKLIASLKMSNFKGVVIFPADNEVYNDELVKLSLEKYPVVLIDRTIKMINLSCIATDNYRALKDGVKLLKQKGYRNICYMTLASSASTTVEDRINGYKDGLLEYMGAVTQRNIMTIKSYTHDDTYYVARDYLTKYPDTDVIITNSGVPSISVINAANELGMNIPEHLRIVYIDDENSDINELIKIKPFIISQNAYEIGFTAAKLLHSQICGNAKKVTKIIPANYTGF